MCVKEKISLNRGAAAHLIQIAMIVKGLNQEDIGRIAGLPRQQIGHYLRREIDLLPVDIDKIFISLGLSCRIKK